MSDDFIELIKANNEQGLDIFKAIYCSRINYIVSGILSNKSDIDECMNDIYFTVWNKIGLYDSNKSSFATWITAVSRNKAVNYLKKSSKAEPYSDNNTLGAPSPEAEVEQKENFVRIISFVSTLTSSERNLFYRKFYYLQSTVQIAKETGKSERSVEGKLYRLRKKLKKKFGGELL